MALSRPVRCSVPTGKEIHRDQKTGTAERRYTSLSPASSPSRIPRNSAAGDWRWRPRALRDKPTRHHYHHHHHHSATNPLTNTSSPSSRPRNFRWYEREEGGSVSSTGTNPLCPLHGGNAWVFIADSPQSRYLDSRFRILYTRSRRSISCQSSLV